MLPDQGHVERTMLIDQLSTLEQEMRQLEQNHRATLKNLHPEHRRSAANLLHYVALRRRDIRDLQEKLAARGLSSLGRTESHVMSAVRLVLGTLILLNGSTPDTPRSEYEIEREEGGSVLDQNTAALLGPAPGHRHVRIMVTVPSTAATDYALVRDLLAGGMDVMRINCAHDEEKAWTAMIDHLRRAETETGRRCRVLMDIPGPKLRTGAVEPGPAVIKCRPQRDVYGRVVRPSRIWLTAEDAPLPAPGPADACLSVARDWLSARTVGEEIRMIDTRGAERTLVVRDLAPGGCWVECPRTTYFAPGRTLTASARTGRHSTLIGCIAPRPQALSLARGDLLILSRDRTPGRPAQRDEEGGVTVPARIPVTMPEFFDSVRPGQPIWLDDGKFVGVIREVGDEEVKVEITAAPSGGAKLGAEKGINVPETHLGIPALTAKDSRILPFIATHADMVGYSFVRVEQDVRDLQRRLAELGAPDLGIVLKIETREGFEHLPALLLAAMRTRAVGVMIARGDLAVECGYERLAEVQEEILWIAEAARLPVIWATQVLETLAKTGMPSRSEITDAAMGERAECVMLNKGPFVVEAVLTLDGILRRMEAHQEKKRSLLRRLRVAEGFATDGRLMREEPLPETAAR